MRRREFLFIVASAVVGGCARNQRTAPAAPAPATRMSGESVKSGEPVKKPNIVVIVADDLGYADLGCYGGRDVPTPNIDSLAQGGARFTSGYVTCPVCSPTRAGLLTGRYQQRFGHEFNPGGTPDEDFGLPLDQVTLTQMLKQDGYATGMVGKWHLGARPDYRPTRRGFDEYYGFLGGAHPYMNLKKTDRNPIYRGTTPIDEPEYLTDAFAREASAFVERHHERPFFLYLAFNAIHLPQQATPKYLDRFPHIADEKRRTMAAMLSAMDDAVGRVLATLRQCGIEDDTLIFFISDNGGPTPGNASRNDPFSGFKAQLWEGGIRIPYIVQWKRHVKPGQVIEEMVSSLDVVPTVLAATGAPGPADRVDGWNLGLYLRPTGREDLISRTLYWRFGEPRAARQGDYKLLMLPGRKPMLFDLSKDAGEKHDLAAEQPQVVKEMLAAYEKWNQQMVEPKWGRTPLRRRVRRRERTPQTQPAPR